MYISFNSYTSGGEKKMKHLEHQNFLQKKIFISDNYVVSSSK